MEIICDNDKCQSVLTLKKLAHWLPIKALELNAEELRKYVDEKLVEAHNTRLSFARQEEGVWAVYLDIDPVILICE